MKLKLLFITVVMVIVTVGCGNNIDNSYSGNIGYKDTSIFDNAIDLIINNNIASEEEINNIISTTSEEIRTNISNSVYNNGIDFTVLNIYYSNNCIYVQASNEVDNFMYKLKVSDNIISDCIVYELYY